MVMLATQFLVTFEITSRYGSMIIVVIQGIKLALGSIKNRLAARPIGIYGILRINVAGK